MKFDGVDPFARHHQKPKKQAIRDYENGRIERLQKSLQDLIELPYLEGDRGYGKYIKEKTGYDFDVFENIEKNIEKIIAQKEIKNKNDCRDVIAMMNLISKTQVDNGMISMLNSLRIEYGGREHKQKSVNVDTVFIDALPKTRPPENKRTLTVVTNGADESFGVTEVYLKFEQGSGCLYTSQGIHSDVRAYWKDKGTIIIETKKDYAVLVKRKQVQIFQDIINIEYIES